jgi:surface carbohydrate biosynthesis protein (TIGR04326 family)
MFGVVAMQNILNLNLFEVSLACIPKQTFGIYLQENQGWEFGLIAKWRANGHGHLVGTPHSTVRYWDLRYFFDPRSYLRKDKFDMPIPDSVACNGRAMIDTYINGGYPTNYLVEVEALRYLYLEKYDNSKFSYKNKLNSAICLLVLGEYLNENTNKQIQLLVDAMPLIPVPIEITVKPHPNCPIDPANYPSINIKISSDTIENLLFQCDIAYSSAVTTASVDAYCFGLPVVSIIYPDTLNLSPLRGYPDVQFVRTPVELATALLTDFHNSRDSSIRKEFFNIDSALPRWHQLLIEDT